MSVTVAMLPISRRLSRDPSLPKPRACRNLFGRPDAEDMEEVDRLLKTEIFNYQEEDTKKYNFNFSSEKSFEGKYQWETCDPQDIPAFYRPVTVSHGKRLPQTPSIANDVCDTGPVSAAVNTTNMTNTLPSQLQARLSSPSTSEPTPSPTTSPTTSQRTQETSRPTSSAIVNISRKKSTQRQRRRPVSSTISTPNQPRITDFLQQRKRPTSSCIDMTNKRSKLDDSRRSPSSTETSSSLRI